MQDQYLLPVSVHFARFTEAGRHSLSDVKQQSRNRLSSGALTLRTPDRNGLQFSRFTEVARHSLSDVKQHSGNRRGAEEARRAHNSEDVRSKLTAGISTLRPFKEAGRLAQ